MPGRREDLLGRARLANAPEIEHDDTVGDVAYD